MKKITKTIMLKEIQNRLPEIITIKDETDFEFSEDEYLGILSWIKYFKIHFEKFRMIEDTFIAFPLISKRLRLDFERYRFPSDLQDELEKHMIYLTHSSNRLDGLPESNLTVNKLIKSYNL